MKNSKQYTSVSFLFTTLTKKQEAYFRSSSSMNQIIENKIILIKSKVNTKII